MQLRKVTITGADNSVKVTDLLQLQERFPFVEWGILLSKSTEGQGKLRFPSDEWLKELEFWTQVSRVKLNLSGHICGRWVRDICKGEWTVLEQPFIKCFDRFQLNFHAILHTIKKEAFLQGFKHPLLEGKQFIFQLDDVNDSLLLVAQEAGINAVPLFDLSGGAGVLPAEWPKARAPFSGFAGGLSPDNLSRQLELISHVAADVPIWIDVETHVRSDSDRQFDLAKVQRFLEIAEPWVG